MKQLTLVEWVRKYKIGESNEDCRECDECECGSWECIATYLEIKIMKARAHGDAPLFMQDFIPAQLEEQAERELEAANA